MNTLFKKPTFKTLALNKSENEGSFEVLNLPRGFGTTLGNSIRRVLWSTIEGAAVVAFKIKGVSHRFESIDGVKEDVLKIILNLKSLVLVVNDENPVTLTLSANTEGVVKASKIKTPPGVEVISKNLEILTLTSDIDFEMEIIAVNRRGYSLENENKQHSKLLNSIAIDSNFSPIESVNYNVKEINTADLEIMEKLIIDVKTNGSISAKAAIQEASQILISYFLLLSNLSSIEEVKTLISEKEEESEINKNLEKLIEELDLSQRSSNALKKANIKILNDIAKLSRDDLGKIKNLGTKSVQEVIEKVKIFGINID